MIDLGHVLTMAGWLLAPICSGLWIALRDQRRELAEARREADKQEQEEREWMHRTFKVLLRKDLMDEYERHVTDGRTLTVERKREIADGYEAYAHYGGNGTGKHMYEAICEIPVEIVK